MYIHRLAVAAAAGLLLLSGGLVVATAAPAAAAIPAVTCTEEDPDPSALWVVVGEPDFGAHGAVDVTTPGQHIRIDEADLGFANQSGGFGISATSGLVNDDNCTDLVVAASGTGGVPGALYVILGTDSGPDTSAAFRTEAPTGADESWGTALALLEQPRAIAVGAPGPGLGEQGSGAVVLYPLSADGAPGSPTVVTQDTPGIPGASEAGDEFGASLARLSRAEFETPDGLVIGAPGEAVGKRKAAGAVTLLRMTGLGLAFTAKSYTQDSAGFPTAAEAGDRFGFSVDNAWRYVAIGVPGETLGSKRGTGMVTVLTLDEATLGKVVSVRGLSQNSAHIPGTNESGDHWGFSVAFNGNNATECRGGGMDLGVGAPYEDVGSAKDAGTVTILAATGTCAVELLRQGAAPMGGAAEKGDYFGWSLSARPDPDSLEEDADNGWVVGVPGEDVDGTTNAGYVYVLQLGWSGTSDDRRNVVTPVDGPASSEAFGAILGSIG